MKMTPLTLALCMFIAAVLLHTMVTNPMALSLFAKDQELAAEKNKHATIEAGINSKGELEKKIKTLTDESARYRETLIEPMLNSYSMRVKEYLDTMAHEAGLTSVEYEEGELITLPIPNGQVPNQRTARRSTRIKAIGDYAAIVSFILRAEKEFPLMTMQSLSIGKSERGVSVDNQSMSMVVEWPCEGEVIQ